MRWQKKYFIVAGLAVALLITPLSVVAASPKRPNFCTAKNPPAVSQAVCDAYDFVVKINTDLQVLTGRVNDLAGQVSQLKATNESQSKEISALNDRLSKLENPSSSPTPTPTPSPSPSPSACGGGYPQQWCSAPKDSIVDSWGMYNRESVSYTAFKVASSGRTMPYWGGHGNANQWPSSAQAAGIPVDGVPKAGDVAISMAGPYGHAMYVEGVSGSKIFVSQYDYSGNGEYSTMTISAAGLYFIHF
jgi:surface antigen